jgi:acetate kinase
MILVFDPCPPYLRWYTIEDGNFSEGRCEFRHGCFDRIIQNIGKINEIEAMGYVLHHGGEIIKNPVEIISSGLIKKLEQCIKFLPEYNDLTFKVTKYCIRRFPQAKHLLFCDTAFFVNLPQEVSTYAVPYELRKKGIRRYGGQGLCHQWAWKKIKELVDENIRNAVSIYLGNHTNMVAIKDGKARETSIGFTNLEGIISTVSCGDIDPTVIFQLHSTGMSFKTINGLLSKESGFTALLGKKSEFSDILNRKGSSKEIALREIYCYNVLKYLGAFISSLGKVDTIIFIGKEIDDTIPFIFEICRKLKFLGLKIKRRKSENKIFFDLAATDSLIKVFCLEYNKCEVLADWIKEGPQ